MPISFLEGFGILINVNKVLKVHILFTVLVIQINFKLSFFSIIFLINLWQSATYSIFFIIISLKLHSEFISLLLTNNFISGIK